MNSVSYKACALWALAFAASASVVTFFSRDALGFLLSLTPLDIVPFILVEIGSSDFVSTVGLFVAVFIEYWLVGALVCALAKFAASLFSRANAT